MKITRNSGLNYKERVDDIYTEGDTNKRTN